MMDYGCQLYNTASPGRLKKLDSIHREGIRICTIAFRTSPVESLNVETNDSPLELIRDELLLRFLYKVKINSTYAESLNTLDDRNDQNYKENERATKPREVYLRRLKRRYMEEQKEIDEGETHTRNDNEKKQHFQQHKEKHGNNKEVYTDVSKNT